MRPIGWEGVMGVHSAGKVWYLRLPCLHCIILSKSHSLLTNRDDSLMFSLLLWFILQCTCPEIVNATCTSFPSQNDTGNVLLFPWFVFIFVWKISIYFIHWKSCEVIVMALAMLSCVTLTQLSHACHSKLGSVMSFGCRLQDRLLTWGI